MMVLIEIYTKPNCPYCEKAKKLLLKKSLKFIEFTVDTSHPTNKRYLEMCKRSNRTTVPQIFINNLHIGGADDLLNFHNQGKLDLLLNKIKNETNTT